VPGHGEASGNFDEGDSKINLIDADAVDADGDLAAATVEAISARTSPAAETARMEELSLSDSPTNKVSKQPASVSLSAKKKTKKRPLTKYDPDKSIIVILDSLEGTHPKAVRVLKDYILEEGRAKRGMEATIEQKTFYVKSNHIPMQENYSDCGVFLLGYAEKFFANPREFSNRLLLREMDTVTDWPNMNASDMRHAMRKIIQDLAEKQKAEQKRNKKSAKAMKVAPLPLVRTDLPSSTPRLQSPFQEKPPTHTELRSQSPRQPSPTKIEGPPIEETLPPPVNTGLPAPKSKQQSPFHVKSPAKSETHLKLPRQPSLAMGEVSPPRRERNPSPIVAIPTTVWNSPKRQISTMVENYDSPATGTAALYPADRVQLAVEIRSPKRQKQSHVQTILSRHLSPEKLKAATRLSSKSPGPSKKATLPDGKQLYPTGYARDFHNQRGSSADPIPIDDSQDGTTTLPPKQIERQTSVEFTKTASSRTPKKTNRSTPTVEKPMMLSTANGEGEVIPDSPEEKRRSPRHGLYK
jgi:sentrin-specific protease 7